MSRPPRCARRVTESHARSLVAALASLVATTVALPLAAQRAPTPGPAPAAFTLEQVTGYPFPTELAAAPTGNRIAWALDERGRRNLWVAEGPEFRPRRLTSYEQDDGQELTSVQLTRDGRYVVYVRGGDHGSNWGGSPPNPLSLPVAPKVQIWSVPFTGGTPTLLGDGDEPLVSPGGSRLAFVSNRGDHSLVGVYANDSTPIRWLAPSTGRDRMPRWSPDGR